MRFCVLLLTLAVTTTASGQTIYKCVVDRRVQYSDVPCRDGVEAKRMAPDGGPTPEDVARARMRVQRDLAEQRQQEMAAQRARDAHHEAQRNAGLARDRDALAEKVEASDNEKVSTHDISGWDRKPKGQVAAEATAKQNARAQARAGAGYDATKAVPQEVATAKWADERVTVNSISGWSHKSRRQQVHDAAKRAYEDEIDLIEIERQPRTVTDIYGRTYNLNGSAAYDPISGRTCNYNRSANIVNCN